MVAESAVRNEEEKARIERDFAIAKQLDHELNARRYNGGSMPSTHRGADGSHQRSSGLRAALSNLQHGPTEAQLENAKAENALLKKRLEEVEAAASAHQKLYQQERVQHHRTYNQARALEMDFDAARKHIHALDEELKADRNELTTEKPGTHDASEPSRGKNDTGAQGFLTVIKVDRLSVMDVVQRVNALNEEIFQMAAYLGEVLVYEDLEPNAGRQEHRQKAIKATYDSAVGMLGETLANELARQSLQEPKEESNPLLVQIVMQSALTNWCGTFGSRWTSYYRVDCDPTDEAEEGQPKESGGKSGISKQIEHDRFISELYKNIRDHGKPLRLSMKPYTQALMLAMVETQRIRLSPAVGAHLRGPTSHSLRTGGTTC